MLKERLKKLREEKSITQRELARLLQISPSTIAMYETEQRVPPVEILERIADFFNVSVDYLLGRTEIRNFCVTDNPFKTYQDDIHSISYEKLINQVRNFFMSSKISEKEKEKFFRDVFELFWQSRERKEN